MKTLTEYINESLVQMITEAFKSSKLKEFLTELKNDDKITKLYCCVGGTNETGAWLQFINIAACGNGKFKFNKNTGKQLRLSEVTDDDLDIIKNSYDSIGESMIEYYKKYNDAKESHIQDLLIVAIKDDAFNKAIDYYCHKEGEGICLVYGTDSDHKEPYFYTLPHLGVLKQFNLDLNKINIYKALEFNKQFIDKNKEYLKELVKKRNEKYNDEYKANKEKNKYSTPSRREELKQELLKRKEERKNK